jgi:hypothetical protein
MEGLTVTFISLYGLLDDLADASVHRSLSDLDPVFTDSRYNEYIVLGGDLNISTQMPNAWHVPAHSQYSHAWRPLA